MLGNCVTAYEANNNTHLVSDFFWKENTSQLYDIVDSSSANYRSVVGSGIPVCYCRSSVACVDVSTRNSDQAWRRHYLVRRRATAHATWKLCQYGF